MYGSLSLSLSDSHTHTLSVSLSLQPPLPDSTSPPHTDLPLHPVTTETPPTSHPHSPPPGSSLHSTTPPSKAAFSVTCTRTDKDESLESPQLRLGTSRIERPVPIRCVHTFTGTHTCMYVCTHVHVHVYTCTYTCTQIHVHVYT